MRVVCVCVTYPLPIIFLSMFNELSLVLFPHLGIEELYVTSQVFDLLVSRISIVHTLAH